MGGSRLERKLRKLEWFVSYKTDSSCGIGRGINFGDLVRVCQ